MAHRDIPWGRVGRLHKAQPGLGDGHRCVGSVWFAVQEGQECPCSLGGAGLLRGSEGQSAWEEALELFGDVGFVCFVCLFVPSAALAQGSTV